MNNLTEVNGYRAALVKPITDSAKHHSSHFGEVTTLWCLSCNLARSYLYIVVYWAGHNAAVSRIDSGTTKNGEQGHRYLDPRSTLVGACVLLRHR